MVGESNLARMLKNLSPGLAEGEYVFCTFPDARYGDFADLLPIASFREHEGLTLVIPKMQADEAALPYENVYHCITLGIHSSLEAVGLTAAFSSALAEQGLSANVMAAFYHDHIFIQREHSVRAMRVLAELSEKARSSG